GKESFVEDYMFEKHFQNVLPEANFIYNSSNKINLIISYKTSTSPPNIQQLQNVINNSNPLIIRTDNPDLNQNFTHMFSGNMSRVNSEKRRNINLSINGSYI
nr:outer membrane beta-barrel protein [Bacteroidota bacterium]